MHRSRHHRAGFTLVELAVVIAVIATIAALSALYFPRYQEKEMVARGADMLQGWLLIAKQQAKRDGLPTGLRLYLDVSVNAAVTPNVAMYYVSRCGYIQQPDNPAQGAYRGWSQQYNPEKYPGAGPVGAYAYFALPAGVTFNPNWPSVTSGIPVQAGDYVELYGGGRLHRVRKVNPAVPPAGYAATDYPSVAAWSGASVGVLELELDTVPCLGTQFPVGGATAITLNLAETNYRIISQPRRLPGEQLLQLPDNVGIEWRKRSIAAPAYPVLTDYSRNLPGNWSPDADDRTSPALPAALTALDPLHLDILFAPSGAVISPGATNNQILLWVRDLTKDNTANILAGGAALIAVQPRTGFIAAHPVSSGADPYEFTKDARSSGL
jgi:prepilin-type N-terminal cleavage/methylation domain-containing protein